MEAQVEWSGGLSFSGKADSGYQVPLGASSDHGGDDDGFIPMELILIGLAGCTAMDVISILEKKRQEVVNFQVRVHATRSGDHPRVFTNISLEYIISGRQIDPGAVERAIELSRDKYCPAQAMLGKVVPIHYTTEILEV